MSILTRTELFQINCLWVGTSLRWLEVACILSMQRAGHAVRLWVYDPVANVPAGTEIADANEVLPRERLLFHRKTGSPALGSDIFRFELMRQGLGMWLDLDMLLLQSIPRTEQPVFGFQDRDLINGAALYIPQGPMLADLCAFAQQRYPIPPFFRIRKRASLRLRKAVGRPKDATMMSWGVFGPSAITYFARKHGLDRSALDIPYFYPIPTAEALVPFQTSGDVGQYVRPETIGIHLWNEMLGKLEGPERGSFFDVFVREELGLRNSPLIPAGQVGRVVSSRYA